MKKLNYFIMLGLSATLILSSCSQQRYAHRAKVRVNDQAKEQVKEEKRQAASVSPEVVDETKPEVKQAEETQPVITGEVQVVKEKPTVKEAIKQLSSKETRTFLLETAKDPKKIKDLVVKSQNQTKQDFESQAKIESSKWLTLVIIGLVLILIGWFFPAPVGGLFHLVGSILVVIGLIFLLLELL